MLFNYDYEGYEAFNDYIDETHPEIIILGMSYLPSKVLYETDPIAYRVMFSDYESEFNYEDWNWLYG